MRLSFNRRKSPNMIWRFIKWMFTFKSYDSYIPGASRSPLWSKVRSKHLKKEPVCQLCGGDDDLEVHHIIPFHINPDRELDPSNLITLCGCGKKGINCHLFFGHLGSWKNYNPSVVVDTAVWREKIEKAPNKDNSGY